MNAPVDTELTPEQVVCYRAELARMGWPVEVPPALWPMYHAMHFALQFGLDLLAARDSLGAEE
jgi:hypothetical protein